MKFLHLTGILALAASAVATNIKIATPTPGQTVTNGRPFTIEVDKPDVQGIDQSVSVAIGLQTCGSSPCPIADNDEILGELLFFGDYLPQRHESFKPPYQNFTVTAQNAQAGNAVIHVVHFHLIGAGLFPTLETTNVSVTLSQPGSTKFKF